MNRREFLKSAVCGAAVIMFPPKLIAGVTRTNLVGNVTQTKETVNGLLKILPKIRSRDCNFENGPPHYFSPPPLVEIPMVFNRPVEGRCKPGPGSVVLINKNIGCSPAVRSGVAAVFDLDIEGTPHYFGGTVGDPYHNPNATLLLLSINIVEGFLYSVDHFELSVPKGPLTAAFNPLM